MDIQFGCDVYVCAVYIVSYIQKHKKEWVSFYKDQMRKPEQEIPV